MCGTLLDRPRPASGEPDHRDEDGTYSARIVASAAAEHATITATDLTVEPAVSGSATLTQLPVHPGGPEPVPRPGAESANDDRQAPTEALDETARHLHLHRDRRRIDLPLQARRPALSPMHLPHEAGQIEARQAPLQRRRDRRVRGGRRAPAAYGFTISRRPRRR